MQVTETLADGLKRELKITIAADVLEQKLMERMVSIKDQVRINGFRPGKVPLSHIKKTYGRSLMAEIVQETVSKTTEETLESRGERAAMQPQIDMTEDSAEAELILEGKKDLAITMTYEVMPAFEIGDLSGITIEKPVVAVADEEVMEQIERIGEQSKPFKEKKGKSKSGDRITMSYLGKIGGEPFDGGADENGQLVLGSGQFIPGFEDQLIGKKAGDETVVKVQFPENYGAAHLAGKEAEFDVVVKEVAEPGELVIDDDFAKNLGLESLEQLKGIIKTQIESQYANASRQKVKRQLLDQLDAKYDFELPPTMLSQEFDGIWAQVLKDLEQAQKTFADEDTTEEKAREEYSKIAARRVRLGLVLAEIGDKNKIQITEDEMRSAIMRQAQQYPGQEREVFEFYQKNPQQIAGLRAPIFEEKVVDYILELAKVTEKSVTKDVLMADEEDAA
ncbi:MAG: trigger factor [Rhizobiales bacterium]|nr:trigger factor [Hyphomicrobiales bacterium]